MDFFSMGDHKKDSSWVKKNTLKWNQFVIHIIHILLFSLLGKNEVIHS